MKIQFNFDTSQRSFTLTPDDELEALVLSKMEEQCVKGSSITLSQIKTAEDEPSKFRVEMKVNGK